MRKLGGEANHIIREVILYDISPLVFIHEMAHIYHAKMPKKRDLNREWKTYCDKEYLREIEIVDVQHAKEIGEKPIFSKYILSEDVANFTGEVFWIKDALAKGYRLFDIGKTVRSYMFDIVEQVSGIQAVTYKLDLQYQYGFISRNERVLAQAVLNTQFT